MVSLPDDENYAAASQLLRGDEPLATPDLAFYEVTNVAVSMWRDLPAAHRLRKRVAAIADDGGLIRADTALLARGCCRRRAWYLGVRRCLRGGSR